MAIPFASFPADVSANLLILIKSVTPTITNVIAIIKKETLKKSVTTQASH